ncbi:hypothetical protein [Anaerobaca lacustris]|uniref:Clan AA aspartic protease n=1 Tax=Anaerobaca lacustris TaxID=3044600 RepID=A0AAW6TY00_9BACT|nr:hypothetical protein [Sedimentisphaerales bacterium M17dextr]
MKAVLRGEIRNSVPYFRYRLGSDGTLELSSRHGNEITADTGFTGAIALPEDALERMAVEFAAVEEFRLADGQRVQLPIFWGAVHLNGKSFETWFIPGDPLVGMEFFEVAGTQLNLDFKTGTICLKR